MTLVEPSAGDTWYVPQLPLPETSAEVVDAWVASMRSRKRRQMSERTVLSRRSTLARLVADLDPRTATAEQVEAWLENLDVKPNSRSTYWAQLKVFFGWLHGSGRREDDPTAVVEPFPAVRGEPRPLSEPEMQRLLGVVEGDPRRWWPRAYVLLGAFAGLRIHEIAKVRGEDIKDGQLEVVGKGGHVGHVWLHERIEALAASMPAEGWWFPTPTEVGHVHRVSVGAAIKRALTRAEIDATPHALRHYYGTAVLAGSDIFTAQKALRHQAISSTQIYAKLPDQRLRDAIASIGRVA